MCYLTFFNLCFLVLGCKDTTNFLTNKQSFQKNAKFFIFLCETLSVFATNFQEEEHVEMIDIPSGWAIIEVTDKPIPRHFTIHGAASAKYE